MAISVYREINVSGVCVFRRRGGKEKRGGKTYIKIFVTYCSCCTTVSVTVFAFSHCLLSFWWAVVAGSVPLSQVDCCSSRIFPEGAEGTLVVLVTKLTVMRVVGRRWEVQDYYFVFKECFGRALAECVGVMEKAAHVACIYMYLTKCSAHGYFMPPMQDFTYYNMGV